MQPSTSMPGRMKRKRLQIRGGREMLSGMQLTELGKRRRRERPCGCRGGCAQKRPRLMMQGQTFERVGIYLPQACFSHGQLYVAESRVGERKGVRIMVHNGSRLPTKEGTWTTNVVYHEILNDEVLHA